MARPDGWRTPSPTRGALPLPVALAGALLSLPASGFQLQLWDHYTFNPDLEFLRARAYPALREAAEFFLAYMVAEPKHGWFVTGPSDSPENWYTHAIRQPCGGIDGQHHRPCARLRPLQHVHRSGANTERR